MMGFVPPRSDRLMELAERGQFPTPARAQIHVGEEDWQSNPVAVKRFGSAAFALCRIELDDPRGK